MKKAFIALFALTGVASADYVWIGEEGTVNLEQWKTQANWSLTESSGWGADGPNRTAGKYSIPIILNKDISFADDLSLNGYNLNLTITENSDVTASFGKFQNATITVDEGSSLTATVTNQMETLNFTVNGTFIVDAGNNKFWNGSVTLGNGGNFTVKDATNNSQTFTINATLSDAITEGTGLITSRTLVTYDNAKLTNVAYSFGEGWVNVGEGAITGAKQYKITNDANGISVSYLVVPEPASATLSLLALCGMVARRRRK